MGRPSPFRGRCSTMLTVCRMGDREFGHRRVDAQCSLMEPLLEPARWLSSWYYLLPSLNTQLWPLGSTQWMREPAPTSCPLSASVHRHTQIKLIKIKPNPHQHSSEEKLRENSKIAIWPLEIFLQWIVHGNGNTWHMTWMCGFFICTLLFVLQIRWRQQSGQLLALRRPPPW